MPQEHGRLRSVSVVIPTLDRPDQLRVILDAVIADGAATEVVVVVDGFSRTTVQTVQDFARRDARVRLVPIEHSGVSVARQIGAEHATSDILLLLDDDVLPECGLVTGHALRHADETNLVVVGYMPTGSQDGSPLPALASLYAEEYERRCAEYEREPECVLLRLWAGNLSVLREPALAVGLHSPEWSRVSRDASVTVHPRHQDRELGIRLRKAGFRAAFDRSLRAQHDYKRTSAEFARDSRGQGLGDWVLHKLHPDLVPAPTVLQYEAGLPAPARWVLTAARQSGLHASISWILRVLVTFCEACSLHRLGRAVARMLRRVEQEYGALALPKMR